jgi:hypothetical protein
MYLMLAGLEEERALNLCAKAAISSTVPSTTAADHQRFAQARIWYEWAQNCAPSNVEWKMMLTRESLSAFAFGHVMLNALLQL